MVSLNDFTPTFATPTPFLHWLPSFARSSLKCICVRGRNSLCVAICTLLKNCIFSLMCQFYTVSYRTQVLFVKNAVELHLNTGANSSVQLALKLKAQVCFSRCGPCIMFAQCTWCKFHHADNLCSTKILCLHRLYTLTVFVWNWVFICHPLSESHQRAKYRRTFLNDFRMFFFIQHQH